MKLRIYGNSLRLRLTDSDLERLRREGRVESWTGFGPHRRLVYALEIDSAIEQLAADFEQDSLTVSIPAEWIEGWLSDEQAGFESMQSIDGDQHLHILVEKDLECLHYESKEKDLSAQPAA